MEVSGNLAVSREISSLFGALRTGPPQHLGELALVPLLLDAPGPDAQLLEEGIRAEHTSVVEVSARGDVNSVRVHHSGPKLLLLVDGEEVTGAKQNRVFNASFLVPAGEPVEVPVSCVEARRWAHQSPAFEASERTMTSRSRARKLQRVSRSLMTRGAYDSNQSAVWEDVDDYLETTGVSSRTAALADGFRARARQVDADLSQIPHEPNQVGIAALHGRKLVSLDLFGSSSLYARAHAKVLRGVLAEVYEPTKAVDDPAGCVVQILRELSELPVARRPAPGEGDSLHGASEHYALGAVASEGSVYHVNAAAA